MGRPSSSVRRLLLAEDDRDLREVLTEVLEACGALVVAVADGRLALDRLREDQDFDVALLDVRMPRMTGLEVLRESKQLGLVVPIVLMTSFGDDALHVAALALGAARVIDKPLDPDQLRHIVLGTEGRSAPR